MSLARRRGAMGHRQGGVRLLLVAFLSVSPLPLWAWGERAHQMVNAAAVENLPEPLRTYFRVRKAYLVEHAIDPDRLGRENPEEGLHHYTDVEAHDPYPFHNFYRQFVKERLGPTGAQLEHGDSVWQIARYTLRLTAALRRRHGEDADRAAIFAAHYACDLSQPLHTVMNYDGQFTNQAGLHKRFETDLVEALHTHWVLVPRAPSYEPDLRARIFEELVKSYSYQNLIFAADRIAVVGHSYQASEYFSTFADLLGLLARKRLQAAISFVSSVWYTAWVRAGKPDLSRQGGVIRHRLPAAVRSNP